MSAWLPRREADRLIWLQNFALKLPVYVGTASIIPGDVTTVNGYRDFYQWILNRSDQVRTVSQNLTEWKRLLSEGPIGTPIGPPPVAPTYPTPPLVTPVAGVFDLIVMLAERIRNSAGYTTAIGEDLGIVAPATDPVIAEPAFSASPQPGSEVRLLWTKGSSDGVVVEGQRAAEVAWTPLGTDRYSPFVDTRAPLVAGQPEVRRYRLRYLDGDEPVGFWSAVVSVVTVP